LNESNTVLLTIQLYHNCSNALHEIKIDRCFKHCWGICTCIQTHTHAHAHTHTYSPYKQWRTKVICQNVNLKYVKLKLKFLAFLLWIDEVSPQCTWAMLRMVRFISTGLLYLWSPVKSWARLLLMWWNTFMSSHLSCIMLQSSFSSSLIQWHPTYTCSSLPIGTCIIP